jgi:2-oxo-4-hydroxy-4-carboxy--5-ureidoimidazoline (OHCU) decarboxylase
MFKTKSTTVPITKQMVKEAYRKVKSNQGSAGIDKVSFQEFDETFMSINRHTRE